MKLAPAVAVAAPPRHVFVIGDSLAEGNRARAAAVASQVRLCPQSSQE